MQKHTLGSIAQLLDITQGRNRPDIKYMIECLNTPEHYEILKQKGFDCAAKRKKRAFIPFSASEYIINEVFKHNTTK